mmetsp:Transcript_21206/g.26889  ORF Transcript_21206/g.26889 Transcript_21206/m.26889 type:complete len:89 (-) Transcript_21206:42-308(-)
MMAVTVEEKKPSSFSIAAITNAENTDETATKTEFSHFPSAVQSSTGLPPVNLFNTQPIKLSTMPISMDTTTESKGPEEEEDEEEDYDC